MKVNLRGNVKLRGSLRIRRSSSRSGCKSSVKVTPRLLREELNRAVRRLERDLVRLRAGIRRDFRRELYSERFYNFIGDAVRDPDGWRRIAEEYLNQPVEVITTAGPLAGTLIRVGEDYLVLQESPTSQLIIPFHSITGIRPQ